MKLTQDETARYDEFITEQMYGIVEPIHAFTAGIAHERARCAWQPIETAPKDGTAVVLFGRLTNYPTDIVRACVSHYSARNEKSPIYAVGWHFLAPGYANTFEPTHWMPLPQPPQEAPAAGGQPGEG